MCDDGSSISKSGRINKSINHNNHLLPNSATTTTTTNQTSPTPTENQSSIGGRSNIRNGRINGSINRLINKSNRINGSGNSSGSQNNPGDWHGGKRGWRNPNGSINSERRERYERKRIERERERHIRQNEREDTLIHENKMDTLRSTRLTNKDSIPTAKANQTMNGISNCKNNNNIRGGNSETHRDCVSCFYGPITLPNSKFSKKQLSLSNARIRCMSCVNCQRHKINVTNQTKHTKLPNHRDCNECGLCLPTQEEFFSAKELLKPKNKIICKLCCIVLWEREIYRKDLMMIMEGKFRVCSLCGFSKPKQHFCAKELRLYNQVTITCLLCAQRENRYREICVQREKNHIKKQQFQQQHHGQSPYQYQINQQYAYNQNRQNSTNTNGSVMHSPQILHQQQYRSGINSYAAHQQQQQQQPVPSQINNSNRKTKNKISKYAYGHIHSHPHHRPTTNEHALPPTTSALLSSTRSHSNTQPNSKQQLSSTSTSFIPTSDTKPNSKMLSPTSSSFIPANGLTIDELLKGMTTVRIEQQTDEDRTYVVDDDDKSIQTTTTTMALLYPPQIQNTTLLVGCHSINNNKNNADDDITTTTTATSTTSSSTITPNDEPDSNDDNGGGRREGLESFLLGSLLDLEDPNEEEVL